MFGLSPAVGEDAVDALVGADVLAQRGDVHVAEHRGVERVAALAAGTAAAWAALPVVRRPAAAGWRSRPCARRSAPAGCTIIAASTPSNAPSLGHAGPCRRRPPRPACRGSTTRPPSSSASAAAARPAPRPAVPMMLWPQAWPMPGQRVVLAQHGDGRARRCRPGPRTRCRDRRRRARPSRPSSSRMPVSRSWAKCSSKPSSGCVVDLVRRVDQHVGPRVDLPASRSLAASRSIGEAAHAAAVPAQGPQRPRCRRARLHERGRPAPAHPPRRADPRHLHRGGDKPNIVPAQRGGRVVRARRRPSRACSRSRSGCSPACRPAPTPPAATMDVPVAGPGLRRHARQRAADRSLRRPTPQRVGRPLIEPDRRRRGGRQHRHGQRQLRRSRASTR